VTDDERHFEVDVMVRDTFLVWAVSAEQAGRKAHAMGYTDVTDVREIPDVPQP